MRILSIASAARTCPPEQGRRAEKEGLGSFLPRRAGPEDMRVHPQQQARPPQRPVRTRLNLGIPPKSLSLSLSKSLSFYLSLSLPV